MTDDNSSAIDFKEKARIFWMVKGYLPEPHLIEDAYDGYFKRLWGNHECVYREDGFEEAYEKKFK